MNIKEFLYKVCNEIKYIPIRKSISEELELHIQDIKENYINIGIIYLVITTVKIVQIRKNTIKKLLILYGLISFLGFSFICISLANDSFRFERVIASFNPEIEPQGTGYVGMLQKEILENSKLVGEASTDVVSDEQSVIIGENNYLFIYLIGKSGILISIILIITIVLTSVRLIFNAKNIKEAYGKFIIIGLCTFYILQFLLTILMNLNLGIKLDISLPFVTFDGISFLVNLLNIALILSIYRRKDITEYENKYDSKNLDMLKKEGIV